MFISCPGRNFCKSSKSDKFDEIYLNILGLLKLTASELTSTSLTGNLSDVFSGVSSLENAIRTLHEAEGKVKVIISKRFDEAVECEDLASVERFFKIFPLINMHEEGLKKFTNYLCSKVNNYFNIFSNCMLWTLILNLQSNNAIQPLMEKI